MALHDFIALNYSSWPIPNPRSYFLWCCYKHDIFPFVTYCFIQLIFGDEGYDTSTFVAYKNSVSLGMGLIVHVLKWYRNDPKFSDRYAWANSADPDQTAPRGAVWSGSTLFAIPSASFGLITLW